MFDNPPCCQRPQPYSCGNAGWRNEQNRRTHDKFWVLHTKLLKHWSSRSCTFLFRTPALSASAYDFDFDDLCGLIMWRVSKIGNLPAGRTAFWVYIASHVTAVLHNTCLVQNLGRIPRQHMQLCPGTLSGNRQESRVVFSRSLNRKNQFLQMARQQLQSQAQSEIFYFILCHLIGTCEHTQRCIGMTHPAYMARK